MLNNNRLKAEHMIYTKDHKTGYLFDPNQPDSLHTAITQMLSATPKQRAQLGRAARAHVTTLCDSTKHYEDLLAIYQSVIT